MNSSTTSASSSRRWSTKRIVLVALFVALTTILSFVEIPIFPAAPWLKYDPSNVIALLAAMSLGPVSGIIVAVVSIIIHSLIMGDPWGGLMSLICVVLWIIPVALIYRKNKKIGFVIVGLVISAVLALAGAIGGNILITPIYAGIDVETVMTMIVPILLPFNALKLVINSVLLVALFKPVGAIVEKTL